jgi:hypothetical protein
LRLCPPYNWGNVIELRAQDKWTRAAIWRAALGAPRDQIAFGNAIVCEVALRPAARPCQQAGPEAQHRSIFLNPA